MSEEAARPCPFCLSWGYNEAVPEALRQDNLHYADMCEGHRPKRPRKVKHATLEADLKKAFTWWLISLDEKGIKPATVSANRRVAAQFCRWWLDQMDPPE